MSKKKRNEMSQDNESYTEKKNRKRFFLPFVVCLLIAFVIWLYASAVEDEEKNQDNSENSSVAAEQIPSSEIYSVII